MRLAAQEQFGQGPPVVLLHGLASTHRWFDLVTEQLAGRRVLRPDHRGHGQSSTPPGGYTVETLATDTADLLTTRGGGPWIVAGHSLGAAVALRLTAERPDLVAGLCLIEGGVYDPRVLFGANWWDAQYTMRLDRRIAPTPAMLAAWARGSGLPDAAVPALLANYRPDPATTDTMDASDMPGTAGGGRVRLRLAANHEIHLARSLWCQNPAALLARVDAPTLAVLARPADRAAFAARRRALQRTLDRSGRTIATQWVDGDHDLPLQAADQVAAAVTTLTAMVTDRAGERR
ncbi:alpha/beta hydrolase [Dactylosporangium sp. NPDC005572]|uniref:alpha/beta fold hydrolase n=1 Tax=Dactylosporangium sp. NPDC005572 TaxID=3156889 RepID=UPI0033B7A7A0